MKGMFDHFNQKLSFSWVQQEVAKAEFPPPPQIFLSHSGIALGREP